MRRSRWDDAYPFLDPLLDAGGTHVWPFDPLFPLTLQLWTFTRAAQLRMNRHEYFELCLLERGELTFQVHDSFVNVMQGDLFVMGSTVFHRVIYTGTPSRAAVLYFLPQLISPCPQASDILIPFLAQDRGFPHVVSSQTGVAARVRQLFRCLRLELSDPSQLGRACASAYLRVILALLAKHYASYGVSKAIFDLKRQDLDRVQLPLDLIESHYGDLITLRQAAAAARMSTRHFSRFFKRVTGQTFLEHLTAIRIEKSKSLLMFTAKAVGEIGLEVGFSSQSHFGEVFRRLMRVSATEYRAEARRADPVAIRQRRREA